MYQNMPTTPITSTQTSAAINSNKSASFHDIHNNHQNPNNQNKFVKTSQFVNLKPSSTTTTATQPSDDPTHEIEEISKKINEHAEAIYRTWKSRGLAPTELLEFYANATSSPANTTLPKSKLTTTTTTTALEKKPLDVDILAATNDFLATVANTTNVNSNKATTPTTTSCDITENLHQLVNSFVVKDKEERAAGKKCTTDHIMTGKSNDVQKPITGGRTTIKPTSSTLKSAIIMKGDDVMPVKNVVVLKRTTKSPSAPLTTTTTATATSTNTMTTTTTVTPKTTTTTTSMLNINLAAAKTKHKIGNQTLQQQQQQSTPTTKTRLNSKKLENSENDNNNGMKIKQKSKTNMVKTIDGPSVEINLNMDLNLNLNINDVNNLSHQQTDNLNKIKELLDNEPTKSSATPISLVTKTQTTTTPTPTPTATATSNLSTIPSLNKIKNKTAKILTENTKTPTIGTRRSENNSIYNNNTKKVSGNVGVAKKVAVNAASANNDNNDVDHVDHIVNNVSNNNDVENCDGKVMGIENLQVAKTKTKSTKAIGSKGISNDKNSNAVESGAVEVDGKTKIITTTPTKTTKLNKINKNQLIDDLVTNNNNNNNNKITSKLASKTLTTTTTIAASTTQSIVTSTANSLSAASSPTAKETKGNSSGNVSVLSDSSRNGNSKNRIKTTTTTTTTKSSLSSPTTTTPIIADETQNQIIKKNLSSSDKTNNSNNQDISLKVNKSDSKSEEQNSNMALVRSNSTSNMPTGSTKVKTVRSNSLTNGTTADKNNPTVARPFLTRGSVAERVMMFEKCPEVKLGFLNIKRPETNDAPPKALIKVKLHATPPPPPDQNSLQREYRNTKSVYIPRFYFPHGKPQPQIAMERTLRNVLGAFDSFPNNQVTKDELPRILKMCSIPFYWRMPVMVFCQQHNSGLVERQRFVEFWKQMNVYCHDAASRFVYILSRGQRMRSYILPEDLAPMVQDVVDTHPGLAFLKEATEFHSRYVHTVIARIFYSVNRSWSGRISIAELKNSDLLEIITLLEEEDDINQIMAFFSYEHFYVIYCKFWELDKDHDLLINQEDLARHSDHALSTRIVERIFSGCVTRNDNKKENEDEAKMSYTDFVWFLLSEEDKRSPTAIEYWFRCMDIDGDGVLSMYELEYFYEEQQQRMESIGIETLPFEDCLCQMLDMIKPQRRDCVTLGDLKRCKMTHVFFDTFFNLEKYLDHEQRDPFASQRDEYPSDWDRFAAQEYELLITEEN